MRTKFKIFLSYIVVVIVGILAYLVTVLIADTHKSDAKFAQNLNWERTPIERYTIDSSADSSADSADSSSDSSDSANKDLAAESNALTPLQAPEIARTPNLGEIVTTIEGAIESIDKTAGKNATKSASKSTLATASNPASEVVLTDSMPMNYIVNTGILNIRATPSKTAQIIKRFKRGAKISIDKIEGEWAHLENGGWAFKPLLKEPKE